MKCRYCGQVIDDKAQFCNGCGMKIPVEFVSLEPGARPPSGSRRKGVSNWLKGSAIGGLIGVVLILVGIVMIITSIGSFVGTAVDYDGDAGDTVKGIFGAFARLIVGAVLISIGGTLIFFSLIGVVIGAIDSR